MRILIQSVKDETSKAYEELIGYNERESEYQRQPRRTQRNVLMRKCWKALLTMPHLRSLEVHIMPVEDLLPAREVKYFEVRDIAPSVFRLWAKGVFPSVYLCVSNENKSPSIEEYTWQPNQSVLVRHVRIYRHTLHHYVSGETYGANCNARVSHLFMVHSAEMDEARRLGTFDDVIGTVTTSSADSISWVVKV